MPPHPKRRKALTVEEKLITQETSTSSSSSSREVVNSREFDVFLSFRGPDVRNKFASHLYDRLKSFGFRVYLDAMEMGKGEKINEDLKVAIDNSRICIPIFSKNYASSKACLLELSHMVQSQKKIIPIFYDATPDDVKLKTELYKKPLEEHRGKSKVGQDEVEKWEKALIRVAEMSGYDLRDKNEANEITSIAQELINQLTPKYQNMTNDLVEIDDEIHHVENLLDLNADGFRIIGIFGMGGVGKTTLAKLIFNKHCSRFSKCCSFLENVREKLEGKRILELQQQLYNNIIDPSFAGSIYDSNDGINKIKRGLQSKKVLLVLDDMKYASQLTDLVGNDVYFSSESRIIITTRDKRILDDLNREYKDVKTYQLNEMNYDRAMKLFSKKAFDKDFPPKEFQDLSKEVVSSIGGLPLALEVFGSSLRRCGKEGWRKKLEMLKKVPNKSFQSRLIISYQGLEENEKEIFLDIACYNGNLKKMHACYMWNDCELFPDFAIETLKGCSLIKVIDDGESLWMHDVLKDLGRAMIQEESHKSGGLLSRLQINDLDFLREKKEMACVETMSISTATIKIKSESMAGLHNLRFLELRAREVKGNCKGLFPNVRWLSCIGVSHFKPMNFNPKNLIVLDLSRSKINPHWKGWSTIKADKLKVLNLSYCENMTKTPSFKKFPSLEVLILDGCQNLIEIDTSISKLKNLTQLSVKNCFRLQWCSSKRSIPFRPSYSKDWIDDLTSLCKLNLSCTNITELPDSIGLLKELKVICVDKCASMRRFPSAIKELKKLEELRANVCRGFDGEIPREFICLSSLRILAMMESNVCSVPELPPSLTHLDIFSWGNPMQVHWSNQFKLVNITELFLSTPFGIHDHNVKEGDYLSFEWIGSAKKLENLYLHIPYVITNLEKASELSCLKDLSVWFAEFQYPRHLPSSLLELRLHKCKFLSGILDASNAKNLETLDISNPDNLEEIRCPGKLDLLCLEGCSKLKNIHAPGALKNLKMLWIYDCYSLEELPDTSFSGLESLTDLEIWTCPSLKCLPDLSKSRKLNRFQLCSCDKLKYVQGFAELESLEDVMILSCNSLKLSPADLSKLENAQNLCVYINDCDELPRIYR